MTLSTWITIVLFFVGVCIGSFLNVLVIRLPRNQSIVRPGSHCRSCQKSIAWYDNLPVVSFLLLKGKCRWCHHPFSIRYLVIELLSGGLFVALWLLYEHQWVLFLRNIIFVSMGLAITFIDLEYRIIPDELSLTGVAIGLLTAFCDPHLGFLKAMIGMSIGFSFFYLLAWTFQKIKGYPGLGGGDIKLLAMVGAFYGVEGVWLTVLVSSVIGSMVGLFLAIWTKQEKVLKTAIPFGPFLYLGALMYPIIGHELCLVECIFS